MSRESVHIPQGNMCIRAYHWGIVHRLTLYHGCSITRCVLALALQHALLQNRVANKKHNMCAKNEALKCKTLSGVVIQGNLKEVYSKECKDFQ